ncbi:MAG: divalent-cation tolerance protein CutA [Candidatus Omnitrophota bacterium]
MGHIVVLVTAKDQSEAEKIARALLEKKLAACCNIIGGIRSLYWWQGKIADGHEVLLLVKSRADLFEEIKGTVIACHSYTVPEIIALPVSDGSAPYLAWLDASLRS